MDSSSADVPDRAYDIKKDALYNITRDPVSRLKIAIDPNSSRTPSDEHFLRMEDVCSRQNCSRCWRQVIDASMMQNESLVFAGYTTEEATALCQDLAQKTLTLWKGLSNLVTDKMFFLKLGKCHGLFELFIHWMPDIPRRSTGFNYRNANKRSIYQRKTMYGTLVFDDVVRCPEKFWQFVTDRAAYHPAVFVRQVDAVAEHDWQSCRHIHTANCFVRLTEGAYGKVQLTMNGGLHEDGVYTFSKAYTLMLGQYNMYAVLHDMLDALGPDMTVFPKPLKDPETRYALEQDMPSISPSIYPSMTEALESARAECLSVVQSAENLVISTIISSEDLRRDYKDRLTWGINNDMGERVTKRTEEPMIEATTWLIVTYQRLTCLSLLYALDKDITTFQRALHKHAKRKGTKTAVFVEWERLERSMAACVIFLGRVLFLSCHFDSVNDDYNWTGFELEDDIEGRDEVASRHRLGWSIRALTFEGVPLRDRIWQFLDYLHSRRCEKKMFHWSSDFIVDVMKAFMKLVDALGMLQPVGVGLYKSPLSAGDGFFLRHLDRLLPRGKADNDFTERWKRRTWTPFRLQNEANFQKYHGQIWDAIFLGIEEALHSENADGSIICQLLELRKKASEQEMKHAIEAASACGEKSDEADQRSIPGPLKAVPKLKSLLEGSEAESGTSDGAAATSGKPDEAVQFLDCPKINRLTPDVKDPVSRTPNAPIESIKQRAARLRLSRSSLEALAQPLETFGIGSDVTKESQWPDVAPRKSKQKTRKAVAGKAVSSDLDEFRADEDATARIKFTDSKVYGTLRIICPQASDVQGGGTLRWDELCTLLTKPPLNFTVSTTNMSIVKFHRRAQEGWTEGVITVHHPHGGGSVKLERLMLDNLKKDLRKTFGWTADDFELVEG